MWVENRDKLTSWDRIKRNKIQPLGGEQTKTLSTSLAQTTPAARKEHRVLQARIGFTCLNHFASNDWKKLYLESLQGLVQVGQTVALEELDTIPIQDTSWQTHSSVRLGDLAAIALNVMTIHNVTPCSLTGTNLSKKPTAFILPLITECGLPEQFVPNYLLSSNQRLIRHFTYT